MNQNDIRWQPVERFQARVPLTKNSLSGHNEPEEGGK